MIRRLPSSCKAFPFDLLPIELLSYIFELSAEDSQLPGDTSEETPSLPFTKDAIFRPLILASVNRHWRNVAQGTSSIWTKIFVTPEFLDGTVPSSQSTLHTSHITSSLQHSKSRPFDIVICGRDPDWDFSESGVDSENDLSTYYPPFSPSHMSYAISLLLPHLRRWKSLHVFTDTWAPMRNGLLLINDWIVKHNASFESLETLSLMRCNGYISYSSFQPESLRSPSFLEGLPSFQSVSGSMPHLKSLTLRGVHVDWANLPLLLPSNLSSMKSLELESHSPDVRPTLLDFSRLLSATPFLERLIIRGSGPLFSEDSVLTPLRWQRAISLPHLSHLAMGYRTVSEGRKLLELLYTPSLHTLDIEDCTYPGSLQDIDASSILRYAGTGQVADRSDHVIVAYSVQNRLHYQLASNVGENVDPRILDPPTSNTVPLEILNLKCQSQGPFASVEHVVLRGVRSLARSMQEMLWSLGNLKTLEVTGMPVHSVQALLPSNGVPTSNVLIDTGGLSPCPCPQLQRLCLRGVDDVSEANLNYLVSLAQERAVKGSLPLSKVDIYAKHGSDHHCEVAETKLVRGETEYCLYTCIPKQPGSKLRVLDEVDSEDEYDDEGDSDGTVEDCVSDFERSDGREGYGILSLNSCRHGIPIGTMHLE